MIRFDFASALTNRTTSVHTQRAYYRWIDRYLVDMAGFQPSLGSLRNQRMAMLNIRTLERQLTDRKLQNWLQRLVEENKSRQALDQARAAMVTLAETFYEAGHMERELLELVQDVSVPKVPRKTTPERLLSAAEMKILAAAVIDAATSDNQYLRNAVIVGLLWNLALRREELSVLRWHDIVLRDGRPCLVIDTDALEIPAVLLTALDRWRGAFGGPNRPSTDTPLLRRIWKGGRIARHGLSPDGIWLIIHQAAGLSGLGTVTPDDLRRSVAAQMHERGSTLHEISQLLRHRNLTITERFLARITPQPDPVTRKWAASEIED